MGERGFADFLPQLRATIWDSVTVIIRDVYCSFYTYGRIRKPTHAAVRSVLAVRGMKKKNRPEWVANASLHTGDPYPGFSLLGPEAGLVIHPLI